MAATSADPLIGTTLGSFRVTRVIGRGGMGTVYLGEHAVIGSRVAIKVLQERLATDENLVARFYAEARAVNLIGHENIVNIFDMNVVPPHRYFLVMEYLEGQPLNYLMTRPIPAEITIPILTQVCEALGAAHRVGIVHRDMKPENIFLIKRGRNEHFVKVLDFGLAKLLDTDRTDLNTAAGLIVGTPEFMSPEQANSAPVDGRSDIYSLGCIAWLMVTGRLPFPQRGLTDLLVAHRQLMPRPPNEVVPSVPQALSDVIMKAMSKAPLERYQDARSFSQALEATLAPQALPRSSDSGADLVLTAELSEAGPSPAPRAPPRHEARFDAEVQVVGGASLGRLPCRDISRGGMFLCVERDMPPVFSKVKITLPGRVEVLAEVVRHVPAEQAQAWHMRPGFGVQFIDLTPPLRDAVNRLVLDLPVSRPAGAQVREGDDAMAATFLAKVGRRMAGDHYTLFNVGSDADFPEIHARARETRAEIETLLQRPLSAAQQAQVDSALERVRHALEVIGKASSRAEYDANRGNFRGVWRCINAGLSPLELEKMRTSYLTAHPGTAGSAHVKLLASRAYEQKGQLREALEACEAALELDPLNLQYHQRSVLLARKLRDLAARERPA